ncbi:MAG: FKBP-type peptidyl-prolyl cis-trans isomerase [Actinomyces sp.]|jgi:peptidylprolyl isomerase|nr:FKBP-type peptidyl-prolyl cis-trans isomerase [Actinomyces sp.]MCI1641701.1 FKBP-type peptidyl-prolyl cis-trans isomerase [Actinomyces sp.]MCI1661826.1 FKBP-type peptidyl-prolyl cis-trans isomerase [Actinomyces sp.]MCI1690668.1 FKBP-type peptidyl-prolyl cis-trans isomerase [Actinomyces sp.]MCI1786732.1 FKBP-type peptidyl-prolyl cis-trans isomerase [Actinomyces sp.]MCI1829126.1 FKBP-type peptidyl-prolyl cis-trans isomerase [Actinomyces sp.]
MDNVTVSGDFGRKPVVEFAGADPANELLVEVLAPGSGREVEPGDQIQCHYLGQVWNGKVFDNSYDRGQALAFQIGVGTVIRGWDDGLVGQRVGSRVLLSIPSDYGYGDRGVPQAGIRGGDTLVFVTDILGAS